MIMNSTAITTRKLKELLHLMLDLNPYSEELLHIAADVEVPYMGYHVSVCIKLYRKNDDHVWEVENFKTDEVKEYDSIKDVIKAVEGMPE